MDTVGRDRSGTGSDKDRAVCEEGRDEAWERDSSGRDEGGEEDGRSEGSSESLSGRWGSKRSSSGTNRGPTGKIQVKSSAFVISAYHPQQKQQSWAHHWNLYRQGIDKK